MVFVASRCAACQAVLRRSMKMSHYGGDATACNLSRGGTVRVRPAKSRAVIRNGLSPLAISQSTRRLNGSDARDGQAGNFDL